MQILVMSGMGREKFVPTDIHNDKSIITEKSATVSARSQSMSVDVDGRFRD